LIFFILILIYSQSNGSFDCMRCCLVLLRMVLCILAFRPSVFELSFLSLCFFLCPFWWVLSFEWGRCCWPQGIFFLFLFSTVISFEWSRCLGPRGARFPFWWVLSFSWSRCLWPRGKFIFCGALLLVKSIFLTSRHEFISYSALLVVKSIFWTSRHELLSLIVGALIWWSRQICFLQCSLLGGVDVLDLEAQIYFLRCSLLKRNRCFWSLRPG